MLVVTVLNNIMWYVKYEGAFHAMEWVGDNCNFHQFHGKPIIPYIFFLFTVLVAWFA